MMDSRITRGTTAFRIAFWLTTLCIGLYGWQGFAQDPTAVDAGPRRRGGQKGAETQAQKGGDGQKGQKGSRRSGRIRMEEVSVASPDGKVSLTFLPNAERLTYTVKMGETTVIEPSGLTMFIDGYDMTAGVVQGTTEQYQTNETYPWHGAHAEAKDLSNGVKVDLENDLTMTRFTLEARAYNDGVAYRLIFPGADGESRTPEEFSAFVMPAGSHVWYHDMGGHYEASYSDAEVSEIEAGEWGAPPLTFKLPNNAGYGSITEANLVNYAGMALENDGHRGWKIGLGHRQPLNYPFELRYGREEGKRLGRPQPITGTITTPWRCVYVAPDLNTLVNSDLVHNLSDKPDPKYFPRGINEPWVEPGLCVWDYVDRSYVSPHATPAPAEPQGNREQEAQLSEAERDRLRAQRGLRQVGRMKEFSRLAGEIGAKYHILEGFAYGWDDEIAKDFVEYSKQQGVRVLFWRHSNQLQTPEAREAFFSRLAANGVAGAKIDFIDHEAKEKIDLYEQLLENAAKYKLVIDFHGSNKPTGRNRTWPNMMITEAVRGMETSSLREKARHQTILPFSRYLVGPCDYTTMVFNQRRMDTSFAHQIASLVTFHSPMLTIAAHPQSVLDSPAADVIKSVQPVWDETRVLPGSEIGEMSIFARRKGDLWMLAVMSAQSTQTLQVPLSFLGGGAYKATYVKDDLGQDETVVMETATAGNGDTLSIPLRQGGGFVARFTK